MSPREALKIFFGYDDFRPLQSEIIASVLEGRDTLALMPTGGGKSICFQVPTLVMGHADPQKRLCLVITPLIALMRDQVANLQARGIHAAAVYTGMSWDKQRVALDNCLYGPYHFLYCSPERLESEEFRKRIADLPIGLIAVDEAHCISQWGYDFRPSYLNIAAIRELHPDVPVLALTATATPETIEDIQDKLGFKTKNVLRKSFHRENLVYVVRRTDKKEDQVAHILSKVPDSAIVYVRNRKRAQELSQWLNNQIPQLDNQSSIDNRPIVNFYHAGLTTKERNERQQAWTEGKTRVIVATNAFGMGIDKPDVRVVIHYDLPSHLESYYQEAGRAGRDGQTAYAVLLYNEQEDKAKLKKRAVDTYPPKEFVESVYHKTMDFLQVGAGSGLGHRFTLHMDQLCQVMRLPVIQTYSALHILTHAGYIDFEEEHETQPRVQILVARHELGEYNLSYEQAELLDLLMRSYTGIYTDLQYVREADENGNHQSQMTNHQLLVSLAQRGIITYIPRSVGCSLTMTTERQTEVYLSPAIFEERQERFVSKLRAMLEYADQTQFCREQVLLDYFGEKNAVPCGHCDVCRELARIILQPM